ncbi:MAG: hypothetical protein HQL48_06280 [Gammaproteobacteria bacterium]|nr:hypothetical protein [Gammaproteobacteria bacterium]
MRVKSKWHKKGPKTVEDIAATAAYIIFRLARSTVDGMYGKGFNFGNQQALYDAVTELTIFMMQVAASLFFRHLTAEEFQQFIAVMAGRTSETLIENQSDEGVEQRSAAAVTSIFNRRFAAYAELTFTDGVPGYAALRYLGTLLEEAMKAGNSSWVAEQVVEVEAPQMSQQLLKALHDLAQQYQDGKGDAASGE